jgi:hypothetical protein
MLTAHSPQQFPIKSRPIVERPKTLRQLGGTCCDQPYLTRRGRFQPLSCRRRRLRHSRKATVRECNLTSLRLAALRGFVCAAAVSALVIGTPNGAQAQEQKPPPDAEKAFEPRTLDLMAIIDPVRDSVKGKWVKSEKKLICQDQHFAPRVQIHYEPPAEYDLIIKFSQEKLRHAITAMLPNRNGGSFLWKVGVQDGNDFELMSRSGKQQKAAGLLKVNTMHTTIVQVRRNSVRCSLDGNELIAITTDFKDLTIDGWNQMPDPGLLGIGCDDPTVFHAVWITEISGPGRVRDPIVLKKK